MDKPKGIYAKLQSYVSDVAEDLMEAAGFSEQESGLLVPRDKYPSDTFSTDADKGTVEAMKSYYNKADVDQVIAIKTLVDADNSLLCAVISKGKGGTSYFYERDERGMPEAECSPMTIIDLAMRVLNLQRENTIISWGALTADFRLLHSRGFAQDEWASIAANHVDMLYQLRMDVGTKLNLQLACISMGIVAVEEDARSFKIEEAIKDWKTGGHAKRTEILDSMRAYCKLLLALYGAVAERKSFTFKPKDSARLGIENAPTTLQMSWSKVWEVHKDKWEGRLQSSAKDSDHYVSVNVMHNWLEEHGKRSKKSVYQLTNSNNTLSDLISSKS